MTPEDIAEIKRLYEEHRHKQKETIERFGQVRPIVHTQFQGRRHIAVGNELYASDRWVTFPDFLFDYAVRIFGKDWMENEAEKSPSDMHQFMQWYFHHIKTAQALPEVEGGLVRVPPDGITESLFLLLYELYVLRHHTSLQQEVIRRLKHPEHFQGARYELFVAATMIRTGCDINYEDENDGSRKHPEFIVHHSATGQRFAVEAKSRHRPGILGYPGEPQQVDQINLGIRRRLKSAVEKDVSGPFIVFMDVNLPPEYVERHGYSWGNEANSTFERLTKRNTQALSVNVAYFTNFPFHYGMSGRNKRYSSFHVSIVRNPKFSFSQVGLIDVINTSLKQYGNVPNEFPE